MVKDRTIWERHGQAYYSEVTELSGAIRCLMTAEPTDCQWYWVAWRSGETEVAARRGGAATVQEAMRAAERAAY
jgi:hypothetical protein